tara:strand:- start:81 stop:344 length:264 start_codon:yes stop_codon:yes gene_type:complete
LKVSDLVNRAQLDVVRNGTIKTVAVKDLLHSVHTGSAARNKDVINPAMSADSYRKHQQVRMQKQAKFRSEQQKYLQNGNLPSSNDFW